MTLVCLLTAEPGHSRGRNLRSRAEAPEPPRSGGHSVWPAVRGDLEALLDHLPSTGSRGAENGQWPARRSTSTSSPTRSPLPGTERTGEARFTGQHEGGEHRRRQGCWTSPSSAGCGTLCSSRCREQRPAPARDPRCPCRHAAGRRSSQVFGSTGANGVNCRAVAGRSDGFGVRVGVLAGATVATHQGWAGGGSDQRDSYATCPRL